ncbi:alpha/beta hydrolase [Burkholderia multivorans]|jgi:pimeloyl-ACP methyl ester carboxylesterase|uniref:alpha/beta fold hydrolase n=1 Tax=Burkholderia multivorans TaxID=87883 RepID=UPI0004AB2359|nr:alpha/beta hydrolase [Burkholderia multivorans]PRF75143.1 alpha/beta hydrolase [Burkholderia multivorans]
MEKIQEITIKGSERTEVVKAWNSQIDIKVNIAGNGPAIVYFHPAAGLFWDPFLDRLAEKFTVYAPEMPGTTVGDPYAIHKIDTFWDLLLIYEEVVRKLEIEPVCAIGQSLGGMVTADLAANFTELFGKVVLLDPIGLWSDDAPVLTNKLLIDPPQNIPGYLFVDPGNPIAVKMLTPPADPEQAVKHIAHAVWSLGCSAKFIWPFPDQGLAKRLHRIAVPTLVIWGKQDTLVPSVYAESFRKDIANCEVEIIDNCGHIPQVEQLEKTLAAVERFILT